MNDASSNPTAESKCPACGATLTADAPLGLCPRCLMREALADDESSRSTERADAAPLGGFGAYDLLEELGHGGMGVVYKARQRSLHRVVALKMLLGGQFAGKVALGRFRAEAELAAQLQHPNIVAIHEIGEQDGLPYFTMDYVPGRSLADLVRDHPLPARAAAAYVQIIAQAIHYAHQQGVLHRDLKPSNILIDAFDQPQITDFGLAKRLTGSTSDLTATGQALGSPNFMPPEQAAGKHKTSGPTSDIYGLGAILYYLNTGRPPFVAENASAAMRQVLENDPVSPRVLNPGVPRDLETLCLKCLQKEPQQRYASAQAVADELGRFLRGEPIQARPVSAATRVWRWCRRKPQVAGLSLALVVLGVTGLVAVLTQWRRAETMMIQEARQRAHAEHTVEQLRLNQAAGYLANGRAAEGVALLAAQLRSAPSNRALAEWVATELTHRSFPLPLPPALRHEKECTFAEFSPDGQLVLTVARDNAARVWVAATGEPLSVPMRHDPSVVKGDLLSTGSKPLEACFSPDGTLVVTASVDGTARIWEARTGTPRTPPLPHPNWVSSARFSPDGRLVATTCRDGLVRLWDVVQGTPTGPVFRHSQWANTVEFSPDGARLLTSADDGVAQVWEIWTGAAVGKPLRHAKVVKMAAFSSDGQKVVTASEDRTARIWQAATGDPIGGPLIHGGRVTVAAFSSDGRWVATASADGTARVWDASTGTRTSDALRHSGTVRWVEFSPEGQRLVTASEDRTVRVWSAATGEPVLEPIHHRGTVWSARFSQDGRRLVTASADGAAQIWDIIPGAAMELSLPMFSRAAKAAWSSDGKRILTVSRTARLWDATTGNWLTLAVPQKDVRDGVFSRSGNLIAVGDGAGTARVWDGHDGEAVSLPMRHRGAVNSVEFSPDETLLATASEDGSAGLWRAREGIPFRSPLPHPAAVSKASFSPDGKWLATAGADSTVRLWDFTKGDLLHVPMRAQAVVQDICFSPNGRFLLSVSADCTVQVWDVATAQPCGPPLKHEGRVTQAIFTPDSRLVVTASEDWLVRVWEVDSGKLAARPLQHDGVVASLNIRPDGRSLLTATRSGRLELWHDYRKYPLGTSLNTASGLSHASFSPDGFALIAAGSDGLARLFLLPQLGDSVPKWLPELADAVAGRTVSPSGDTGFVAPEELLKLRRRLTAELAPSPGLVWAKWCLADKSKRNLAPGLDVNLNRHIARCLDNVFSTAQISFDSFQRTLWRAPDHGGLLAHYARKLLENESPPSPGLFQQAEWLCTRAIQICPEDPRAWLARASLCEQAGRTNDAAMAMEKVKRFGDYSPYLLAADARFQERTGQLEAALDTFRQSVTVGLTRKEWFNQDHGGLARHDWTDWDQRGFVLGLTSYLRRLGRHEEEHQTQLLGLRVPARAPDTPRQLVNLDATYTESLDANLYIPQAWWFKLSALGKGPQTLNGIEFDVRGIVHLDSKPSLGAHPIIYPERVEGIPIGQPCRRIHLLHATVGEVAAGTVVAIYRVHLQDGTARELPVIYGRDVAAWDDELGPAPTGARVAWQGRSPGTTRLRLFHTVWDLPTPGPPVMRLDFVSQMTASAPFLIAVTVE